MKTRHVSVIIPHYNHGRIIRRQLDAVLRQTLEAHEIIVVDDGSPPDKLAEITAELAAIPNAKIIRMQENGGAARACNVGLSHATGAYVCFLACDDKISPDLFSSTTSLLEAHPQAAFCFSDPAIIDPRSGKVSAFPLFLSSEAKFFTPDEMLHILSKNFFTFSTNTILFRRDHLETGMPERMGSFADNFLDFRLALSRGAVYIPKTMGYFYAYSDSYSAKRTRNRKAMRNLTFCFLETLEKEIPDELYDRFRHAGVLPEHSLRALGWLLSTPQGRRYLTGALAMRCATRTLWRTVMPAVPKGARHFMRRIAARISNFGTAPPTMR